MLPTVRRRAIGALILPTFLFAAGCNDLTGTSARATDSSATGNPSDDGSIGTIADERRTGTTSGGSVFLLIDEDSIDNGNEPNDFSETEVNDDIARLGQRRVLRTFERNVGAEIDLFTGQVGDEGWFALKRVPRSWRDAGPTNNGTRNLVEAGPGLGEDDSEDLLDDVRTVTPLRATALSMLVGQTVFAIVWDSDISINYSPLMGSLKGENLGVVAFEVLGVRERRDGSSSDLPRVTVRIVDAREARDGDLLLFANAPEPRSSGEPFDIRPPYTAAAIELVSAP